MKGGMEYNETDFDQWKWRGWKENQLPAPIFKTIRFGMVAYEMGIVDPIVKTTKGEK